VKLHHFKKLSPICPSCVLEHGDGPELDLQINSQSELRVIEGHLHCPDCRKLFPILHGVPILVPDVETYLSQSIIHAISPSDTSDFVQQWLTESTGPSSAYTLTRQYISTYAHAHYNHQSPHPPEIDSGFTQLSKTASRFISPDANALDIGCSVGGSSFGLAESTKGLVLGVDISLSMIRFAQSALEGKIRYGRRRVGTIYDPISHSVDNSRASQIDFWVADALYLPFKKSKFGHSQSIHLLDCVSDPSRHLIELIRILKPNSTFSIICPYDWSTGATSFSNWLGGYGYFQGHNGSPEEVVRWILSKESPHIELQNVQITSEVSGQAWRIQIHERSTMHYQSHIIHGLAH
jgi:ubiquinone/menaquinone biosynthesis C-methylase UbiE/uncharacterized protein YbaR (Trm112 family)